MRYLKIYKHVCPFCESELDFKTEKQLSSIKLHCLQCNTQMMFLGMVETRAIMEHDAVIRSMKNRLHTVGEIS
jgi:hypothetical protein